MDPSDHIDTVARKSTPAEENIINTIYIDLRADERSVTHNETYQLQSNQGRIRIGENAVADVGVSPTSTNFRSQFDVPVSNIADVQDVLHAAINESCINLGDVNNDSSGGLPESNHDKLINCDYVTSDGYFEESASGEKIFNATALETEEHDSLKSENKVQLNCILYDKRVNITDVQSVPTPRYSTPNCVYYNIPQPLSNQTQIIDERGLKILADVVSDRPSVADVDNASGLVHDTGMPSATCLDTGSGNMKPFSHSEQQKEMQCCIEFLFSNEVIDAWRLIEEDQLLHLMSDSISKEGVAEIEMKKTSKGLHLSIGGPCLSTSSRKQFVNGWHCALRSSTDCNSYCDGITGILQYMKSRTVSEVGIQVTMEMLSANADNSLTANDRKGSLKRKRSGRNMSHGWQQGGRGNGSVGSTKRLLRSNRDKKAQKTNTEFNVDTCDMGSQANSETASLGENSGKKLNVDVTSSQDPNVHPTHVLSDKCFSSDGGVNESQPLERSSSSPCSVETAAGLTDTKSEQVSVMGEVNCSRAGIRVCDGAENGSHMKRASEHRRYERYKHTIRSDRSLNKQLYLLNRKVAKSLNYDLPGDSCDYQVCIICGNVSQLRWLLLVHLRRFHILSPEKYLGLLKSSPKKREEELEALRKVQSQETKQHLPKLAGVLPCDYCGEEYHGIRNMKRHLKLKHGRLPPEDLSEKINYYVTEYGKLIHRNRMIAIRKENLTKTEYPCRYCNMVLSMSCTRSRHEIYTCRKNPNRRKRFHCTYCGTAYRTKEALEKHKAKHAQHDFKFVCDRCGKEYKTKPMLYEHKMKIHHGREPRFTCSICKKSFHYKDKLEKHLFTHSDKRDVMCDICGKLFKTKGGVQKHTKYVHKRIYPHHCEKCGHGVAKLSYLKTHKCDRVRRSQGGEVQPSKVDQTSNRKDPCAEAVTTICQPEDVGTNPGSYIAKVENASVPLSVALSQDNVTSSSQFTIAAVNSMTYQTDPQQAGNAPSVEQFIENHYPVMSYIGPAPPTAFPVSQFINPLPSGAIPVYTFSQSQDGEQMEPAEVTLLEQQPQNGNDNGQQMLLMEKSLI